MVTDDVKAVVAILDRSPVAVELVVMEVLVIEFVTVLKLPVVIEFVVVMEMAAFHVGMRIPVNSGRVMRTAS